METGSEQGFHNLGCCVMALKAEVLYQNGGYVVSAREAGPYLSCILDGSVS
jgi:hypothetical protein